MMMIPEPWEKNELMSKEKTDFYEFHNFVMSRGMDRQLWALRMAQ
jgi:glutamate synthase domain-containing protein 1